MKTVWLAGLLSATLATQTGAQSALDRLYDVYNSTSSSLLTKRRAGRMIKALETAGMVAASAHSRPQISTGTAVGTGQSVQGALADNAGAIQTACNPIRPSCQPLQFKSLPANARVRVYTLTGVLIKDTSTDSSGQGSWDGTNQAGRPVSSGVYVIFVQGEGAPKRFKVGVQR